LIYVLTITGRECNSGGGGDDDPLVGYDAALRRNLTYYVTGEVGPGVTEFMVGSSTSPPGGYSNPLVDVARPLWVYVVQQSTLDGISRRAVSEHVLVHAAGRRVAAAAAVVPWWWSLLIVLLVLAFVVVVVVVAVVLCWLSRRHRAAAKEPPPTVKVYAAEGGSPGAVSPLAVSYMDALAEDRRSRRGGTVSTSPGLDSYSDTDGEWSFPEPRPVYGGSRSPQRCSRCVPVGELRAHCEGRLWADGGRSLAAEFALLPPGFTGPVSAATRPSFAPLNRSPDAVPYDHNRVRLASGRYVNASVVRTIGRRQFVVTQYPTDATLREFWQLVWERGVDVIVALAAADAPDCRPYWPAELNRRAPAGGDVGGLGVELVGAGVLAHFAVRELVLERRGEAGRRRVAHWQYTWWCEADGVPCHPADFVDFVRRVRDDDDYTAATGVLVHGGGGAGGAEGLYLAVDALLDQGVATGVVNVLKCVSVLRAERAGLVRSLPQYNFIYQCLCEHFDHPQTRLAAPAVAAQPCPGEFQLVFAPAYFDHVRPLTEPAKPPLRVRLASSLRIKSAAAAGDSADETDDLHPAVTLDSFVRRAAFVVAQCPRPLNADEFWALVDESSASCIVSLGVVSDLLGHELVIPQQRGASVNTHRHLVECRSDCADNINIVLLQKKYSAFVVIQFRAD